MPLLDVGFDVRGFDLEVPRGVADGKFVNDDSDQEVVEDTRPKQEVRREEQSVLCRLVILFLFFF